MEIGISIQNLQAQFSFSLIESTLAIRKSHLDTHRKIATVDLIKRFKNWIISMNTNYTGNDFNVQLP